MISVALFYSFNSISTQFSALGMLDRLNYLSFTSVILKSISVLVCFIIGNLVVYANRFMLRRRKKEIGLYYLLGIENKDLNRMLFKETLIIGTLSLVIGMVVGIVCSQGLTYATGKLIGIGTDSFVFMISYHAIFLSILFFAFLFVLVYNLNKREINKLTLLELISSERKNDSKQKNSGLSNLLSGILGLILAALGYYIVFTKLTNDILLVLGISIAVLIASSCLLILSTSKLLVVLMKSRKNFYYRQLNPFVVGQIGSHMKSNSGSSALTGSLLFLALALPIIGIGLGQYAVKDLDMLTPYDATIYTYENTEKNFSDHPMSELTKNGFHLEKYSKRYAALPVYRQDKNEVIGLEDYNRALMLQGKQPILLKDNEFAVNYDAKEAKQEKNGLKRFIQNPVVTVGEVKLKLTSGGIHRNNLTVSEGLTDYGTLIVPQKLTENLDRSYWVVNLQFLGNKMDTLVAFTSMDVASTIPDGFSVQTKDEVIMASTSNNLIFTYLGIYLGVVLLITAGTVLALQQLAYFSDNQKRYKLLENLGAGQSVIRRSIRTQLNIYFGIPFIFGLIYSTIIIFGVFRHLLATGVVLLSLIAGSCFGVLLLIYIIYYWVAYTESKRILANRE